MGFFIQSTKTALQAFQMYLQVTLSLKNKLGYAAEKRTAQNFIIPQGVRAVTTCRSGNSFVLSSTFLQEQPACCVKGEGFQLTESLGN